MREDSPLLERQYRQAREMAERFAAEAGEPLFYREGKEAVGTSRDLLISEAMARDAVRIIAGQEDPLGHGLLHVEKVAVDAGAIVFLEGARMWDGKGVRRVILLVHLAGILHDIRRTERNHAERGAEEADRILGGFDLDPAERRAVTLAIRNHEAFQPHEEPSDPAARLISNALYDADKFRWGPDNFTETLWAMLLPRRVPLEVLLPRFLPGLESLRKIRETFRTETGRRYGPDFIDRGLAIGLKLHAALTERGEPGKP
jgi:hypothetical protein